MAEEERRKRRTDTLRILNWQWDSLLDRIITSPYLERLKDRYEESGSGYFLFHALMFCASRHVLIPDWADRALHKHFGRWTAHEVRTLDEAFNLRYRKGKHLRAARLKRELSPPVHRRIMELKRQGQPIDQNLFRQVGKEFQISRERVRVYYSSAKKALPRERWSIAYCSAKIPSDLKTVLRVHGNLKFP